MIRTSIIVSPRQEAADRLYFYANGLQIDVATASQLIVRTSHRPVQIYSATRTGARQQASNLTSQTGFQGQRWQRLMDILDRQGSDALAGLFTDGELNGEWITALDERRLNALLSDRFTFFLFRGGSLRELRPVSQLQTADQSMHMNHYRIQVNQDDQILILPRDLIQPVLLAEAELVLSGMQQLPVRLSELGARLRERGVTVPFNGWMALQVLRAEPEYTVQDRGLRAWLAGRRKPEDDGTGPGYSDGIASFTGVASSAGVASTTGVANIAGGVSEAGGAANYAGVSGGSAAAQGTRLADRPDADDSGASVQNADWSRRAPRVALMTVIVIVAIASMVLLYRVIFPAPPQQTTSTTSLTSVTTTVRPTVTPTVTPTKTPTTTTTAPLPEWYVIARKLNLRSEPNVTSTLIRVLTTGQSVFILEQPNAEWTKIRTPEGEIGFVYAAYISKDKPAK